MGGRLFQWVWRFICYSFIEYIFYAFNLHFFSFYISDSPIWSLNVVLYISHINFCNFSSLYLYCCLNAHIYLPDLQDLLFCLILSSFYWWGLSLSIFNLFFISKISICFFLQNFYFFTEFHYYILYWLPYFIKLFVLAFNSFISMCPLWFYWAFFVLIISMCLCGYVHIHSGACVGGGQRY